MAYRTLHAAVIYPSVMLNLEQMFWKFAPVYFLVLQMSSSGTGGWYYQMRTLPAFNDEEFCVPTVFEGPVTNHDCCACQDCPGNVHFCRLRGLMLDITGVGERGCGMLLKAVTYACAIYDIWGEFFCQCGGSVIWRVDIYVSFDFFEPPVTRSALSSDHWHICLKSCLGMFQESLLLFGVNPPCWVCVRMKGYKFEWGG